MKLLLKEVQKLIFPMLQALRYNAKPLSKISPLFPLQVSVIMGSDSDLSTMKSAAEVLEMFGISVEVTVVSAHRTPERMLAFAKNAHKRGVKVIIAGAGSVFLPLNCTHISAVQVVLHIYQA